MKRIVFIVIISCALGMPALAQEAGIKFNVNGGLGFDNDSSNPNALSDLEGLGLALETSYFNLVVGLSYHGDKQYSPSSSFELGHYFTVDTGLIRFSYQGLAFEGGRGPIVGDIDSPYSLFLSSKGNSSLYADLSYRIGNFSYTSKWVQLNYDSTLDFEATVPALPMIDRGMNYKEYTLNFGRLKLGYQDSSVYCNRNFDLESFLSPVPTYIQQLTLGTSDRPYSQQGNTNSLMGIFGEYNDGSLFAYSQFLLDDINGSFLGPVLGWLIPSLNEVHNLQKLAWSIGGTYGSPYGKFGFHHGGATKYTFEATYTSAAPYGGWSLGDTPNTPDYNILPYQYTYYPVSEYLDGTMTKTIRYTDNYIGFKYGENTLCFLLDYRNEILKESPASMEAYLSLEYVVSGSKSPNNPWHDYSDWTTIGKTFELLDEAVLEHDLILTAQAKKRIGNWDLFLGGKLGYRWNRLGLRVATDGGAKIWTPVLGDDGVLGSIGFYAKYSFGIPGSGASAKR